MNIDKYLGDVYKDYKIIEFLGNGQFGVVYKVINLKTQEFFAIKIICKEKINQNQKLKDLLINEINIMKKINHKNIIHLYDYFESKNNYYWVIDFCNNGDLSKFMKKNEKEFWMEKDAIFYLKQISSGFKELKKNKIFHRDFKIENIFLQDDCVKIGDFGFSKFGDIGKTNLGTPITMAPELLNKFAVYTNKADLWSIGVVYYQLLYGIFPFSGKSEFLILKDINEKDNKIEFKDDIQKISDYSKDILNKTLQKDHESRINWNEFFNHKLFKKQKTIIRKLKTEYKAEELKVLKRVSSYTEEINEIEKYSILTYNIYFHYLNKFRFFIYCIEFLKKLINYKKEITSFLIFLIYEKSKLICNNIKTSLELKLNLFEWEYFDNFLNSNYYILICDHFKSNLNLITKCLINYNKKYKIMNKEVNSLNGLVNDHKELIKYIDNKILENLKIFNIEKFLIEGYIKKDSIKNYINNTINYLYFIGHSEKYLKPILKGKLFNWNTFFQC